MRKKSLIMVSLAIVFSILLTSVSFADVTPDYQNPLMRGADPTITRAADGFYYSCFAVDNDIYLKKADTILGVGTAKSRLAWAKPADFGYVWGPYIYRLDGKWYIYFTSGPETSFGYGHPSSYVLENTSPDPFEGTWVLKGVSSYADEDGQVTSKQGLLNTQGYGLACGVVTMGGKTYFTYTKYFYYPDPNDPTKEKFDECPTIVQMSDPWTLTGTEGTLARPVYAWEKNGDSINEGAAVVERNGKVYFAYSASSFMNDNYAVGVSTADSLSDLLQESNWTKSPEPAMSKSPENSTFGPGSPLFVKSEDGTEDWLIYHGGPVGGQTGSNRWVRAQRINWNDDGSINLGVPSNPGTVLDRPSGEEKSETYEAEDAAFAGVTRTILSDSSKASGSGVMKFDSSSNGYVEFTVDANTSGSYCYYKWHYIC
jgi:GH43 family beta-xylosidase